MHRTRPAPKPESPDVPPNRTRPTRGPGARPPGVRAVTGLLGGGDDAGQGLADPVGGLVGPGWPASSQAITASMATTGASWAAHCAHARSPITRASSRRAVATMPLWNRSICWRNFGSRAAWWNGPLSSSGLDFGGSLGPVGLLREGSCRLVSSCLNRPAGTAATPASRPICSSSGFRPDRPGPRADRPPPWRASEAWGCRSARHGAVPWDVSGRRPAGCALGGGGLPREPARDRGCLVREALH